MIAIHATHSIAAKRKKVVTPNQSRALAPPRGTDSISATPRIASGRRSGIAFTSRASPKAESTRKKTPKATSGRTMLLRVSSIRRDRHTAQAASGQAGHAYQGRIFRKYQTSESAPANDVVLQ